MKEHIQEYLREHKTAWSPTTLKSERSRLNGIADHLDKTPEDIYALLVEQGRKAYSIKTTFIRLGQLEDWALDKGYIKESRFSKFMQTHRNRFKHAYVPEEISITFDEAKERIETLPEPHRTMALGMLATGVRLSEAYDVIQGKVRGKGGKVRKLYGKIEMTAPRGSFSRKLKSVGLKPHTLRKLCATRLAETGATPADLCKVFGWSSIKTAYQYLQAKDDEKLQALMEKATKG